MIKKSKSNDESIHCKHNKHKWFKCPNNKNGLNYACCKGEKKRLKDKMGENKNKSNKGEKSSSKWKKNDAFPIKQN